MGGYKLTGRGWVLLVVLGLLLITGATALAASFGGGSEPPAPPGLSEAQPPANPISDTTPPDGEPAEIPSPPGEPDPSPEEPSDEPAKEPPEEPPPVAEPSRFPSPVPVPDPSRPPEPQTPEPPEEPAPSEDKGEPVEWYSRTDAVMFSFNSAEPSESPERTLEALDELIPDISELAGYLVVVEAYVSEDETAVNLAQKRADYVSALLIEELGVPAAQVRAYSADGADGGESWRQRADVYFSYVGYK